MKKRICLLGLRGSIPVSGPEFTEFGCATSAMVVYGKPENGEEDVTDAIVIDAGTGLLNLRKNIPSTVKKITILISHIHLDHIQGLLMFPEMFNGQLDIDIYCGKHCDGDFECYFKDLMKPPIWPITTEFFAKNVRFLNLPEEDFKVGDVMVSTMAGSHPNDIDVFKLTFDDDSSIVHVGDYEVGQNKETDDRLKEFAKGASLLLMDGMYSIEEYTKQRGFGHSPWEMTAELANLAGVRRTRIIHHAPNHTDEMLREAEASVNNAYPNTLLGREGEVLEI